MINQNISLIENFFNSENENQTALNGEKTYLYLIEDGFLSIVCPISLKVKIPTKKAINTDWLLNKLNIENTYKNISENVQKLLNGLNIDCFNVYSTSYGIGVFSIYNKEQPEQIKHIENYLNAQNIEFKTEYSPKCWVYRFIISKKTENLNKIEVLK